MENEKTIIYGIEVPESDVRYNQFVEELKDEDNEDGELFNLHECTYGLNGWLIGGKLVVGYVCQSIREAIDAFDAMEYETWIKDFLGEDYYGKYLRFYGDEGEIPYDCFLSEPISKLTIYEYLTECDDNQLTKVIKMIEDVRSNRKEIEDSEEEE